MESVDAAIGHSVRQQDDGGGVLAQVVVSQLPQALHGCGVNIRTACGRFCLHLCIESFQLAAISNSSIDVPGVALEGDEDIDLMRRGLEQILLRVLLNEDLAHGLHHLLPACSLHTSGVVQTIYGEGGLAEFRLVQVQALHQHAGGGHPNGREHPVWLDAPVGTEHIPVLLGYPLVPGAAACALDLVLNLVGKQVFLQIQKSLLLLSIPVVHIAQGGVRDREAVIGVDGIQGLLASCLQLLVGTDDEALIVHHGVIAAGEK